MTSVVAAGAGGEVKLAWVSALPAAVREAFATPAHPLHAALSRLDGAADRLGLSTTERTLIACLLAQDVDETLHGLIKRECMGRACTRSDLLNFAGVTSANLEALVRLEARGIVQAADDGDRSWAAAQIALAGAIRSHCLTGRAAEPGAWPALLPRVARAVDQLADAARRSSARRLHVVVRGRRGSGRDAALDAILHRLGTAAHLRTPLQLRGEPDPLEPELSGCAAVWDAREVSLHPDDLAHAGRFLARSATPCVSLLDADDDAPTVPGRVVITIDTDPRDAAERAFGWRRALAPRLDGTTAAALASALAERTRAGIGLAHRVAEVVAEPPGGAWTEGLAAQLEAALQPSALRGVTVEHPEARVDSIVVAEPIAERIRQLLVMMRHATALATPTRVGVKAMLSGPSGTGKTLTARALAAELGRPLYRIDLATVVSKWVGETEKNLRHAMQAAETAGALLLFDEGDALFGARGEVTRGADRYANMEVSYLLQALELFDGLVVVTTNLRTSIDRAFLRRFDVLIDFPKPDATQRAALWHRELGADADAVTPALLDRIATESELTGGNIAVACRAARALALGAGTPIADEHLVRALSAELRSLGSNVAASRWSNGHRPAPGVD